MYAIEILFLGKNLTYVLESIIKDCEMINAGHDRMRGTPTPCITCYAEQNGIRVSYT